METEWNNNFKLKQQQQELKTHALPFIDLSAPERALAGQTLAGCKSRDYSS